MRELRSQNLIAWGILASLALLGLSLAFWAVSKQGPTQGPAHFLAPEEGTPGQASTYDELVVEADAIVIALVKESGLGRVIGDSIDPLQFRQTTLAVETLVAGEAPSSLRLETEQELPFDLEWWKPGTRVVAFVWLKRDRESAGLYHRLVGPEGIFILEGSNVVPTTRGLVSTQIEGVTLSDVESAAARMRRTQ